MRRKTCQDVSQFVDVDLIRARKLLILLDRFLRRRSAHRSVTRLLRSARHMRRPGDLLKIPGGQHGTHKQQHLDRSVPLFLAPLDRVVAAVLRHAGVAASVCGAKSRRFGDPPLCTAPESRPLLAHRLLLLTFCNHNPSSKLKMSPPPPPPPPPRTAGQQTYRERQKVALVPRQIRWEEVRFLSLSYRRKLPMLRDLPFPPP